MMKCGHCARRFSATGTGLLERTVHELAYHAQN